MATLDVSSQRESLLNDANLLAQLPIELLEIIRNHSSLNFLDAVAEAALVPQLTDRIFAHFEPVFADICARWILSGPNELQQEQIIAAFARILPFSPYLAVFLEVCVKDDPTRIKSIPQRLRLRSLDLGNASQTPSEENLLRALLAVWRLLSFDSQAFRPLITPVHLQRLFKHPNRTIRYVAIRIFCQVLQASDFKLESLIAGHVGISDAIIGDFDGQQIDYGFLTLYEHRRAEQLAKSRRFIHSRPNIITSESLLPQLLTPLVICHGRAMLPRPLGPICFRTSVVPTATAIKNLEDITKFLQNSDPILVHGLPGSGKTSIVHEVAKELGMYDSMVTLHLNEQTDAKMLIGLYSTDSKPGSFQWRPGVLTTAVREGRWVLVEDLDRAPNEVMSTLLPLVERGELLIPSRGERIQAASGFRLFGTIRTSRGMNGRENLPNILGQRFWQLLPVMAPPESELQEMIVGNYPLLQSFIPGILSVYKRLAKMFLSSRFASVGRGAAERHASLRDLLKWCRRLSEILTNAGSRTGSEPISEATRDEMFLEALDCFAGSLPDSPAKTDLVFGIAEEMHISKERAEHFLNNHIPRLEDCEKNLRIGRTTLKKKPQARKIMKSRRVFASTAQSKRLMEQIATAVSLGEPMLLVGETGIGKTTVVQQLADSLGQKLVAVNLSQQSEVGDLLGGFKPLNVRTLAVPLKEEFEDLFSSTGISTSRNEKYLGQIGKCFARGQWARVSKLWREAPKMFANIVETLANTQKQQNRTANEDSQPLKRKRTESKLQGLLELRPRWDAFSRKLDQFDIQISGGSAGFAFSFVEGNIIKAARNGDWVLLDEINLASPDTLESIADLLSGPDETPSILLSDKGEIERLSAHPNFRVFGAMNPATDVGKRDLPVGIRSRFTEIYVDSPDKDLKDLLTIIKTYLKGNSSKDDKAADDIARLYLNTKRLAEEKRLVDGANEVPHFSLRTLTRVLSYVNQIAPFYGLRRALYEGFSMGFLTLLDKGSEHMLMPLIYHHLFEGHGNSESLLSQPPRVPNDGKLYIRFKNSDKDRHYWLYQGAEPLVERPDYIITPYVERNLLNLVRATSTRRFPILIQGPTSSGKTSMIEYLANFSGNKFVRINNHEHTDLQEYLGTYISGPDGMLQFQEGLLVQAMRRGYWIVLDELNLAPTDVLEALNRLLDDNRELLIPETQEVVKPHEDFMLFATQNPPGLYGGRKVLSRAFRNRFLELHFDDIPEDELEYILQERSKNTAPSDCKRIATVYKELSRLRQTDRLFEKKDSFATLRDLFRWAFREADTREQIAVHGFMLLAERVRNEEERTAVKKTIEAVFKVKIDPEVLYNIKSSPFLQHFSSTSNSQGVVWTYAMRRLYILVASALRNNEPVLLVGETGCGKTSVCQLLAEAVGKELQIVNAHQNTETGDLIGSQRPVRNRAAILDSLKNDLVIIMEQLGRSPEGSVEELLEAYHAFSGEALSKVDKQLADRVSVNETRSKALFEWADGSLVHAMRSGQFFLLDEISLADDSVLERLNSVLEPRRTLLLAEKGVDNPEVLAAPGFQFLATMNPGGDFGKKELSPALRNRFTEIWVPPLTESDDILEIVNQKLHAELKTYAPAMVHFAQWFGKTFRSSSSTAFSIRDILAWVQFANHGTGETVLSSLVHGASTVFIDSLGANPSALIALDRREVEQERQKCLDKLSELIGHDVASVYRAEIEITIDNDILRAGEFSLRRFPVETSDFGFALHAPTTKVNTMRVVRALQMPKPILLEGSPGVGKTTLVEALARHCGRPLTRINLSDQTDLMDLFGTDVPIEGAEAGNFAWRDAPFLQAMQRGEWVLLDEMNLASQSVLEGLNACLDHRGEVYISELDQTFKCHPEFRLFAAQNPHHQGGGRKGLPSSFVNRFTVVYADSFTGEDLLLIASHKFPKIHPDTTQNVIQFITSLERQVSIEKSFGSQGGPWEFNLRDILRWLEILSSQDLLLGTGKPDDFLDIIVRQRFRVQPDRKEVDKLFSSIFQGPPSRHSLYHGITSASCQTGLAILERNQLSQPTMLPSISVVPRLGEIESLLICVKQNMPCVVSGPSGSGKSALLQHVAAVAGKSLVVFPLNADVDTMDLVGGFEQSEPLRVLNGCLQQLREGLQTAVLSSLPGVIPEAAVHLLDMLDLYAGDVSLLPEVNCRIAHLLEERSPTGELGDLLAKAGNLLQQPLTAGNPRFEWLDGMIVKAVQTGQWLVLDNANLCSASVLDRLNSLLEPNGFLSINEHCGPDGEPRLIQRHPDFRVFLTMDPRYGELSRAMRNRAIEIHINPLALATHEPYQHRICRAESSVRSYTLAESIATGDDCRATAVTVGSLALDNLSLKDARVLHRFASISHDEEENVFLQTFKQHVAQLLRYLRSANSLAVREAISHLYSRLPQSVYNRVGTGLVRKYTLCRIQS
jgi:midasin